MSDFTHILDTRGLILRAYHGCKDTSVDGHPSWQAGLDQLIHDVLLPHVLKAAQPRQVIAALDRGNQYRRSIAGTYKENRRKRAEETPSAVREQTKILQEKAGQLFAAIGIKQVSVPGEEADDLIAHLVERLPGPKMVHTVDQDLIVLAARPNTTVYRSGDRPYQAQDRMKGVAVRHISLMKSLVGDSSDNFGGVSGFGPKAFERLQTELGDDWLDWLMAVISADTPDALGAVVETHPLLAKLHGKWGEWRIGWQLARLNPSACYGVYQGRPKRPEWVVRMPSKERLDKVFGPNVLDAHFGQYLPTQRLIDATQTDTLQTVMAEVLASPIVAYDYETTDRTQHACYRINDKGFVDVLSQELTGLSINYGPNMQHTVYVPFDHTGTENFAKDWAVWILQVLDQRADRCVVQNAAFELTVSQKDLGVMPRAPYDTAIMHTYVDEEEENGLKGMSRHILNYKQLSYAEVTQGRRMDELTGEEVLRYGCDDSWVTAVLFDLLRTQMHLEGSWDFYAQHEVDPAVDDAFNFIEGTLLDQDRLAELREASAQRMEEAEAAVREALSHHIDPTNTSRIERGARALLDIRWETDRYKHQDDPEKAADAYQSLWERSWGDCIYQPMQVTEEHKAFVPSLGNLNNVIGILDPKAPKLWKTSVKAIEAYDMEAMAHMASMPKGPSEYLDFVSLLFAARKSLAPAKRSGTAYENLVDFCQQVFDEHFPVKQTKTGTLLNFGSGPQMQAMLYGMLLLPIRRRSKVAEGSLREAERLPGSPATGLKAVASALVYDVVNDNDWRMPVLLDYAKVCKEQQSHSLYFKKYPNWVSPEDGRLHPQVKNCGTRTRRPSGTSPNILQVAKGDMRTMFPAGDGRVFVSIDFASQELVLTACATGDETMLAAFTSTPRMNMHSMTAAGIAWRVLPRLGVPCDGPMTYEAFMAGLHSDDPTIAKAYSTVRNKFAKQLIFSIIYGASPLGVAENLLVPKEVGEQLVDALFALYPGIPAWQDAIANSARRLGYVELPFGTRRHAMEDLWSSDRKLSGRQERQLSNSQIQGGAAEILKVVRQRMFDRGMRTRYQLRSVFPIYDEITASVPVELAVDYVMEMADIMRVTPPGYPVGMEVEASVGKTWGQQIEIGIPSREGVEEALTKLETSE